MIRRGVGGALGVGGGGGGGGGGVVKRKLMSIWKPEYSSPSPCSSRWSLLQWRGAKSLGSEVRSGNIIQRKGRIYQVIKAQHTQHGRGGASIQAELRDVDTGNKVVERFRTDETIDRVYVEDKSLNYLYSEGDIIVLTHQETFEQIEVPKELFGKNAVYLKDDMNVTVQYYDERIMSASVPQRVTCTVVEAQTPMKGLSVNPQYKKVLLDNGLTVLAPPFIVTGDEIVVDTTDDSYITRNYFMNQSTLQLQLLTKRGFSYICNSNREVFGSP